MSHSSRCAFALALVATLALGGCATVRVDEATAFAPPAKRFAGAAADAAELDRRWAARFSEPAPAGGTPLTISPLPAGGVAMRWAGDGAGPSRAWLGPRAARNGLEPSRIGPIAWTVFTPLDVSGTTPRPLVVHCAGNAGDRYNSSVRYSGKALPWADVLVWDYPGYGDSAGRPGAADFEAAAEAVSALAVRLAGEDRPLVFWGHSLGGFVCARLAERTAEADGLVIETSARAAAAVARAWIPAAARPFLRAEVAPSLAGYDSAVSAARFGGPVLVFGAAKDRTLPVALHRDLARAIGTQGGRVTYVEAPEAGHQDVPAQPQFQPALAAFFAALAPKSQTDRP